MNAIAEFPPTEVLDPAGAVDAAIDTACAGIAPTWPLDRFIAVNPFWGHRHQPIEALSERLRVRDGTVLLMPRDWYRAAWRSGRVTRDALARAAAATPGSPDVDGLIAALADEPPPPERLPLLSDCVDRRRDLVRVLSWREALTTQISQYCASWFDVDQADWQPARDRGLYDGWRTRMCFDHSLSLLMGAKGLPDRARQLPTEARATIHWVLDELAVPADARTEYLAALLGSINGWAAWCAYRRWDARLAGGDDDDIIDLLAIRCAWEFLLDDGRRDATSLYADFVAAWSADALVPGRADFIAGWAWQRALEYAYQDSVVEALTQPRATPARTQARPAVQAAFCIDVRSEVFRRALEAVEPGVQTLGFAGFFGLPIAYTPLGAPQARPQLPGLLAPALMVGDDAGVSTEQIRSARHRRLAAGTLMHRFRSLPSSMFTFVESIGAAYLGKLIASSLPARSGPVSPDAAGLPLQQAIRVRPRLLLADPDARTELAAKVLSAMSLTGGFARLVLFVGHGSQSANNPVAAGLDCGACCGQTGEVNARVLADLLQDASIRSSLKSRGILIPDDTCFVAGLHNTTTDEVTLFDTAGLPASHTSDLRELQAALVRAGDRTRRERAPALGFDTVGLDAPRLLTRLRERANDWSQLRPEWGLANNAAFVVAPRARTRGVNLAGRSFLHDYHWQDDADGSILELIMTAPMVVTHWINMQYNASSTDNRRYGSGNKVLHNVVGGRIGVFEGNGGDLRIGLPMQSLHDGERWLHEPLRLSVFIEAPRAMIDTVIGNHEVVRDLVDNRWLHLHRIDPESGLIEARRADGWRPFSG